MILMFIAAVVSDGRTGSENPTIASSPALC